MKLLVDHQLPPALARHLNVPGTSCVHVRDVSLHCVPDLVVRNYAKLNNMVIISKDKDFRDLAKAKGTPPQVVWVRLRNCRSVDLIAAFDQRWKAIEYMLSGGTPIVELH